MRVERYWQLNYEPKPAADEREVSAELLHQLRDAVKCRLISDVPLGAFLSGGVDSATIVALMSELGSGPVKTFSIGFGEEEYNELPYARLVAQRFGTDHHEFVVTPHVEEILPKLVWHYNEPFADPSAIPTYYLSQLTREHVTVALNGDGGDESFAGYRRYLPSEDSAFLRLPLALRRAVLSASRSSSSLHPFVHRVQAWLEANALDRRHQHIVRSMMLKPGLRAAICTPEFMAAAGAPDPEELWLKAFADTDARNHVDAMLATDGAHYLPDVLLVKVDIASMAHSLEARSPLLDHVLMEFVAKLPSHFKIRDGALKFALKRAVRGLICPRARAGAPGVPDRDVPRPPSRSGPAALQVDVPRVRAPPGCGAARVAVRGLEAGRGPDGRDSGAVEGQPCRADHVVAGGHHGP